MKLTPDMEALRLRPEEIKTIINRPGYGAWFNRPHYWGDKCEDVADAQLLKVQEAGYHKLPMCPGVIVERKARQIGYTIAPNEPGDVLEEKEVPCPLLPKIDKEELREKVASLSIFMPEGEMKRRVGLGLSDQIIALLPEEMFK